MIHELFVYADILANPHNNTMTRDWDIKIEQSIKSYWNACDLPRKQKKKVRKLANQDYQFYHTMKNWDSNLNFNLFK